MARYANSHHGEHEIRERQGKSGPDGAAQNVEIQAQPGFEEDDHQGDGCENRSYCAKVFGRDQVENRAKKDADDREKQNIRDPGATKETGECMCHEDEKSYDEDVSGYMHVLGQGIVFDLLKLLNVVNALDS